MQNPNKNEYATSTSEDSETLNEDKESSLTNWKFEPPLSDLLEDLEYARQENLDQTNNVNGWIALRDATGAESGNKSSAPGRSKVQPKLVRKNNEWRYPGLSEPFLNTPDTFRVFPHTYEDKLGARQNQLVLNWQFNTKLKKVDLIDRYVRTAVDEGTCILRVGWCRTFEKVKVKEPVYDYYQLDPTEVEGLQALAQATELYINKDPQYEQLPEELKASVEYSIENEIPVYAEYKGETEVIKNKMVTNQPDINIVNIKNFYIDPSCEGVWTKAQYFIYTYESTASELKKKKIYKNLDKVSWSSNAIKSKLGNRDHTTNSPQIDSRINPDKQKVLIYEYWGLYDIHGDGVMLPIVVTWIGDTIIQMEENPFPDRKAPFVIVPYMPILQSSFGESDASLLQDNQRIIGALSRGMIDLLGRSANAQTGFAKGYLDPVNRKRFTSGEDFEFNPNGDPEVSIRQMKYPELPNSALQLYDMYNREGEGLTGVKAFSSGITGESYGRVARGISGALDAAGLRELSILRRLVEGMLEVATKIISMNKVYLSEEEVIRVTNEKFVTVRRDELEGNFDLKIDISTQAQDEQRSNDLGFMLQTQGPNMDPGLEQIILSEIAELKRMPDLAQRIRTYQPQPDPLEVRRKELEIADLEADVMLKQAKAKEALAKAENTALDTELDATGTSHERNMETSGAQARANRNLEVTKGLLEGATAPGNIEAAVGFNEIVNSKDSRNTDLPVPPPLPIDQTNIGPLQNDPTSGTQGVSLP